uniref:Uncharacterized protein n=1 Tax=Utricularia reniformis TaxID=192314 RepID=A0A1Y0AZV0_9LAMI|nr:hypothetical protein AEK19_MT0394 [Utricularia reniformis]ART30664.1 hypothetical protein AEK19_MT0394 [Utricularia reniformis]
MNKQGISFNHAVRVVVVSFPFIAPTNRIYARFATR